MLIKLSLRNSRHQLKEYGIYIITMIISVCLLYCFNSFVFSEMFQKVVALFSISGSSGMKIIVVFYSTIMVFIIGWLISYMLNFMLRKRSAEFGTYLLLGMEKRQIVELYILENSILGVISLFGGLILGIGITNIFNFFAKKISEGIVIVLNGFSYDAFFLTFLYFVVLFGVLTISVGIKIRKLKLITLINYERFNEAPGMKDLKKGVVLFVLSLLGGISSIFVLYKQPLEESNNNLILGCSFVIICLFSLYYGICPFIFLCVKRSKSWKYKSGNIFLFRNFANRINKITIQLGLASSALVFSLLFLSTGISYGNNVMELLQLNPFDVVILHKGEKTSLRPYYEYLEKEKLIDDSCLYNLYTTNRTAIMSIRNEELDKYFKREGINIEAKEYLYDENKWDMYIKYSDYNSLRDMLGYKPVKMSDDEFMIHCMPYLSKGIQEQVSQKKVDVSSLKFIGIRDEEFQQYDGYGNGQEVLIVVPDEYVDKLQLAYSMLAADLTASVKISDLEKFVLKFDSLEVMETNIIEGTEDSMTKLSAKKGVDYLNGRYVLLATKVQIVLAASLCFLGTIMSMIACFVLAIHFLSDNLIARQRYAVLNILGYDKKMLLKLFEKYIFAYYLLPIVPALILGAGMAYVTVAQVTKDFFIIPVFTETLGIALNILGVSVLLIIMSFIMYAVITYLLSRKEVFT